MVWPFTSPPPPPPPPPKREDRPILEAASSWVNSVANTSEPLGAALDWAPVFASTVIALGVINLYKKYLRRIPNTAHIEHDMFGHRSFWGKVTSVGDGDGLQLYHTPGGRLAGWGWARRVPTKKVDLKGNTLSVRLAGIDAPESAHFGRPAQPFSFEAHRWLMEYMDNRYARVRILRTDQYSRVIGTVYCWRWGIFRKDVGLEMLKRGLATTYEAKTGVEFGGKEVIYRAAEEKAKKAKIGIWGLRKFESPRDYKDKHKAAEAKKV